MPDRTFEPLRIRAYLQCGVVSDEFLPLDGVLYYIVHREVLGAQTVTVPGSSAMLGDSESRHLMPFRPVQKNRRHWHYACSFAQWPVANVQGIDHWAKRFDLAHSDLIDFGKRRGTVAVGSGPYKGYHMPVYYRHALYIEWYACADRAQLESLLRFATHLGKKTSQGWGAVLRWQVDPWPEDWSVHGPGGRLMRAVYDASSSVVYGLRPSYWNPQNHFPVRLPVQIRPE